MTDVNVRSDSVDVEQIMRQIRGRIRDKRGVDYTEAELQQLAKVKLEKFLDPRGVRSDLLQQFKAHRVASPAPPNFEFGEDTLYETHRGPLRMLRRLLRPLLKLFFNPDKIVTALHIQSQVNLQAEQRLRRLEEPLFELLHNLTVEITRLGIEVQNLKMRVESVSSRLDFDERRGRALESTVQYRQAPRAAAPPPAASSPAQVSATAPATTPGPPASYARPESGAAPAGDHPTGEKRRRRRRRRRRPGQNMADAQSGAAARDNTGADSDASTGNGDAYDAADDHDADADIADAGDGRDGPDSTDQ